MKGSFYSKPVIIEKIVKDIKQENERVQRDIQNKVSSAINLVYYTAKSKRASIGKGKSRTSDPGAQFGVPVKTGALRASIQKDVRKEKGKIVGVVWTDSPYAEYVEFGTSKMKMRPFMRPALFLNEEAIKGLFDKKL